ncbi:MAG TPA: hypothetical protein DCR93_33350 [Cytophagales bacterium]|nr:hypothetical protein [Cytophagales bacterium]
MKQRRTLINWATWALLFLLFSWWHGAFEGPLSEAEINHYVARYQALHPDRDAAYLREFLQRDSGGPVVMLNAIKLYDTPLPIKGEPTGSSSEEVLNTYSQYVIKYLIRKGSYPLFVGEALYRSVEHWGIENAEDWTSGGLIRYRSLRTMMEMSTNPEFAKFHDYKVSAIEKTMAYPTQARVQLGGLSSLVFFIFLSLALGVQLLINRKR